MPRVLSIKMKAIIKLNDTSAVLSLLSAESIGCRVSKWEPEYGCQGADPAAAVFQVEALEVRQRVRLKEVYRVRCSKRY